MYAVRDWSLGRRVAAVLAAGYCVCLVAVLLGPADVPNAGVTWLAEAARRAGAPERLLVPSRFAFIVNALVFMPLTALGSRVWPLTSWRDWTAYGFVLSSLIELAQGLLLPPGRFAQFDDVVANTLGAASGAIFIGFLTWLHTATDSRSR